MKRAFTLFEVLVVITIMGILATIVIVNVNSVRVKGRIDQAKNDVNRMVVAYENFKAENLILTEKVHSCTVDTDSSTLDTCNGIVPPDPTITWDLFWTGVLNAQTLVPPAKSNIIYTFMSDSTGLRYTVCAFGGDLESTYIVGKDADINVNAQRSECTL